MTSFPIHSGLGLGIAIAGIFLCLLLFSGAALLVGFIWGHRASFRRRGPLIALFIALISSQLLFIVTLGMFIVFLVHGGHQKPGDFFYAAFWPFTTGLMAYLASWRIRRSISTPNDHNA